MVYQWKVPGVMPVDAQTAGTELERIYATHGRLEPSDIVDESRDEQAPLHRCFEWNDAAAAEKYRQSQAANIIRSIVTVQETERGPQEVRSYVHVQTGYQPISVVVNSEEQMNTLLRSALRELSAFRQKYSALSALLEELFPLAEVITPNIPEAERLCGFAIEQESDMLRAAEAIGQSIPGGVLVKGGHREQDADDLLLFWGEAHWYRARRVDNPNNHGSGCTLSSAIASFLALGCGVPQAVGRAKAYITACMEAGLDLGAGSGPLKHNYVIKEGGAIQ